MEKKLSDPEDTEEEKDSPIKRKKPKHEDKSAYNELDESDGEIMNGKPIKVVEFCLGINNLVKLFC